MIICFVFFISGTDLITWMMRNLDVDDQSKYIQILNFHFKEERPIIGFFKTYIHVCEFNKNVANAVLFDYNVFISFLSAEALHLAHLMSAHGYLFPIDDHILTVKNDNTYYRFQVGL